MTMSEILSTASVDQEEMRKFNKLAKVWWDKLGPMWPLHTLNELRCHYIVQELCKLHGINPDAVEPLSGISVLDIGCGGGLLAEAMARQGADVHGVDISERNIEIATKHARSAQLSIRYEASTAEALEAAGYRYDVVLNMEVVEHVSDLRSYMEACNRLLNPAGVQFVATINRNWLSWVVAIFGAEYVLRWLPRGTHQWRRLVKPSELERLLSRDGLELVTSTGVLVNPFTRSMSLGPLKAVNYMMVAERPA